jgi:hypothetical protein
MSASGRKEAPLSRNRHTVCAIVSPATVVGLDRPWGRLSIEALAYETVNRLRLFAVPSATPAAAPGIKPASRKEWRRQWVATMDLQVETRCIIP